MIKIKYKNIIDLLLIALQYSKPATLIILLNSLLRGVKPVVQALLYANFINTALAIFNGTQDYSKIFIPIMGIMLIIVYNYINNAIQDVLSTKQYNDIALKYVGELTDKCSRLSYKNIENPKTWDLIFRTCIDPVPQENFRTYFSAVVDFIAIVISITSTLVLMASIEWKLDLVILALIVPIVVVSIKAGRLTYNVSKQFTLIDRFANHYGDVMYHRQYTEERALFGFTKVLNEKYTKLKTKSVNKRVEIARFNAVKTKGVSLFAIIICLVIIGVLLFPLQKGILNIGMFIGMVNIIFDLISSLGWDLSYKIRQMVEGSEYIKDVDRFLMLEEQPHASDKPVPCKEVDSIEFRNVSFQYPYTERFILKGCSFTIKSGISYAFVGVNGAGKSTVTKLLIGLYDNYEGDILINNKNLKEYTLPELKSMFSVIFQDYARYFVSMKENVLFGNILREDNNKWKECLESMEIYEKDFPDGYRTNLGKIKSNSLDLSGGQWQRLAIARTLYSNASVYIMDEPTAALDPMAESKVYQTFSGISKGKTSILITHRLGAAKIASKIFVLSDGKIAEEGRHDELMQNKGLYAEMFESQKGWYVDEK